MLAHTLLMTSADVFRRITSALEQSGIQYMLTGSFASSYYGALRSTQDIDFVIDATASEVKHFVETLPASEYYADLEAALVALDRHSLFNVIDLSTGWKIDLMFRKRRAFSEEEFRRRQRAKLQDINLFVASPEDMIVAKLEWSKLAQSQRQIEDAATILRIRKGSLDRTYLERWVAELGLAQEWQAAQGISERS